MDLSKGIKLFEYSREHPFVIECHDLGDARRAGQTKHGYKEHVLPVVSEATRIARRVAQHHPGLMDEWTINVIVPFGALLHDIGGRWSIEEHDKQGAIHMRQWLRTLTLPGDTETLPVADQKRICRIIAYHRAGRYLKNVLFQDPALDAVLLADKSIGDEDRVRAGRAFMLKLLTWFHLAAIPLRRNGEHDRINFALRKSMLHIGDDGVMELRMEVKDDVLKDCWLLRLLPAKLFGQPKRSCLYSVIFDHAYYKKNFHSMEVAAANLGYKFYLCFNGTRFGFDKENKTWRPA